MGPRHKYKSCKWKISRRKRKTMSGCFDKNFLGLTPIVWFIKEQKLYTGFY